VLYDRHMSELRKTTRKRFRIAVVSTIGLSAVLGAGMAGLLALAMSGRLALAETATAAGALLILGERIMVAVDSVGDMYEAGLFVEDFSTFLATAPITHGATGTRPAPPKFERISVDHVTFTYPAAAPALTEVSLEIAAGEVIALVGENGSGKTTLAKLLSRLYLPGSGTISWDGVNIADLDADHIYVLDRGRIIEHGNHDQLITAGGVYAELFTLQAAAYTDHAHPNGHRDQPDTPLVPHPAAPKPPPEGAPSWHRG
jgi:ATP-binding cassette subfamily B protein